MNRAHATGIPAKVAEPRLLDEFLDRRQVTGAATVIVPATGKRAGEGGDAPGDAADTDPAGDSGDPAEDKGKRRGRFGKK